MSPRSKIEFRSRNYVINPATDYSRRNHIDSEIIKLCTCEITTSADAHAVTPRDEHLAIAQQRGRVRLAPGGQ